MRFVEARPYADPATAARRLLEIANTIEPIQDGRIHIEKINLPFLREGATPGEYGAALDYAIAQGWLWKHGSGTYVKFTPSGAELKGWQRKFEELIELPDGRKLKTLAEAMAWLAKEIPKSEHKMEKVQNAAHLVTRAAEHGGPMIFAQMGMVQAVQAS